MLGHDQKARCSKKGARAKRTVGEHSKKRDAHSARAGAFFETTAFNE